MGFGAVILGVIQLVSVGLTEKSRPSLEAYRQRPINQHDIYFCMNRCNENNNLLNQLYIFVFSDRAHTS